MNKQSIINIAATALIVGCFTWILKPNRKPSNESFELKAEIQELKYQIKIDKIELDYANKLHLIENGGQKVLDSLWTDYGHIIDGL